MQDRDVVIVGSGFGGSLLAMVLHRLGLRVTLIERGKHPRFAIGESTTPLMNLLIEQLAKKYDLPRLLPLTTYGAWQEAYPDVVCGKKRGFTYYHHKQDEPFVRDAERQNELLVAASPHDFVADTHWLRASVDHFLVQEAVFIGVDYQEETSLMEADRTSDGVVLRGERHGNPYTVKARFLVDATGPRGFLSRLWSLPEQGFANYPNTQALFSHFTGVALCEELPGFFSTEKPPYPVDAAALHHVFEGGWMWVLRFDNGVTSAGFSVTDALANELGVSEGEPAWGRFLARFPSIAAHFVNAKPIERFFTIPTVAYRVGVMAGENWCLLPSAAAFVDPLFSSGMPLTLLGIERLGRIFAEHWNLPTFGEELERYAETSLTEADATAHLVSAAYAAFANFPLFANLSMFYFASASYGEMARRVENPHLITRFLGVDRADYAPALERACTRLQQGEVTDVSAFAAEVARAISLLNIAGLACPSKRNWYGVELEDTIRAAGKLEVTSDAMRTLMATAEWAQFPKDA